MNNVRETINTMLVKTFHEILELEEKAIITDEFSDISNNDMHIIEAIGLGEGARMSVVAKRLNITVGSLTTSMNSLVNKGYVARSRSEKTGRLLTYISLKKELLLINIMKNSMKNVRCYHGNFKSGRTCRMGKVLRSSDSLFEIIRQNPLIS